MLTDRRRFDRIRQTLSSYFIGHGVGDSTHAYICPYESHTNTYASDISEYELKGLLDPVPAQNVLVILDSYYSGGFSPNGGILGATAGETAKGVDPGQFMDRFGSAFNESRITNLFVGGTGAETNLYLPNYYTLKGNRYTVLMAAETDEDSYASNIEGGILPYYLTGGLKSRSTDTNKDTWVSAEEAFRYAAPKTASEIKSAGMYQNPRMFDGDSSHDVLMASHQVRTKPRAPGCRAMRGG
jgi:uncharacterized caspase-like protein